MNNTTPQSGFTLLEAIVAIGIILIGIVSIVALATVVLFAAQQVRDEFFAQQLARESVESVRSIRDTYWMTYDTTSDLTWQDFFPHNSAQNYAAVVATYVASPNKGHKIDYTPTDFGYQCPGLTASGTAQPYDCTAIWYSPTGQYNIQTTDPTFDKSQFTQTKYSRLAWLYPLCRNATNEKDEKKLTDPTKQCSDLGNYVQVGVDVVVTVEWPGKAAPRQYTIEENMYDWK